MVGWGIVSLFQTDTALKWLLDNNVMILFSIVSSSAEVDLSNFAHRQ